MYELLTGKHPFYAENFSRLVQKVLNEEPPSMCDLRSDVTPALEAICRKALAKKREDRYQTGLELASDLNEAFETILGAPQEQISEHEQFNLMKSLDFFQGFPDSEVWEIVRAGRWQEYAPEEEIIVEGDIDDSFYIIARGRVAVVKNGRELRPLDAGHCFGEMGYLTKTKRTATIVARAETALLKVNSTVISQVSLNCQVRFLKVFLRTLIHRLSATTQAMSQEGA